jgi:4-amino-4-deoxy-L-arabinose transferase-like glycosyltransferase
LGRQSVAVRVLFLAAVVLIVGVGAVVRVIPIRSGLPYTTYVDEGHYLKPTAHMVAGTTWQVGRYQHPYQHPTLPYDLIAVATEGARLFGVDGIQSGARVTDRSPAYDVLEPEAMIVAGRLVDVVLATATILLTILLAWKLIGRTAALAAGIIIAMTPALVSRSPIVIVDTPAVFFVMLALLLLAYSMTSRRQTLFIVLAGVASGLAFTSKYPSGAVFIAVVALVWRNRDLAKKEKTRLLEYSAIGGAVAALVTMPGLLLAPVQVATDVISEVKVYVHKSSPTNYAQDLVNRHEVGWLVVVLALLGVFFLWRRAASREFTIAWLFFAVPFALYLAPQNYQPFRNLIPLLPFLAIGASATLVEASRFVGRHTGLPRVAQNGAVLVLAALVALSLFYGGVKPSIDAESNIVDSRTQAVDWLETHTKPGDRILVAQQLAILPNELAEVPGQVVVTSATRHLSAEQLAAYDYIVTGDFKPAAKGWPEAGGQSAATFGQRRVPLDLGAFRGNDQIVSIARNPAPAG